MFSSVHRRFAEAVSQCLVEHTPPDQGAACKEHRLKNREEDSSAAIRKIAVLAQLNGDQSTGSIPRRVTPEPISKKLPI